MTPIGPILRRLSALAVVLVLAGCDRVPRGLEPDKIISITPETQMGVPGQTLVKSVQVELLSTVVPGVLGGKGEAHPMAGVKLVVVPADPASGLKAIPDSGLTDAGGNFDFDVQLGHVFGDQYLDVVCESAPEIKRRLRFIVGVVAENNKQEVAAGDALPQPLRVKLVGGEGEPLANTPVYFTLARQPGKSGKVSKSVVKTDANGVAEVGLKTDGSATGRYEIRAEVADPKTGVFTRPFAIEAMAFCTSGILIAVLGGLAIFIYGMTLMSEGLQQVAGNKLKATLAYVTRNRVTAIMAGAFVTALVQSSSATTVMTVGFVNAGLLSLQQAIGVVFGANIGTTITGQMVSFKLDGLALPAAIIGVVLLIVSRKTVMQGVARTILGFGLLFFGMTLMSNELKNISAFPTFVRFFQTFDCTPLTPGATMPLKAVLGAVGIGTALTILVQSSSATIGLTIALANSGLINFWTAIPIVLGDNIGTTITAVLASLSANRTAKQTAAAHSMFNVLGTVIMIGMFYVHIGEVPCFYYLVNSFTAGDVFIGENIGRHVAMGHSLFNVTNVFIMTPFIGVLVWLCEHIVPGKKAPIKVVRLETHLLNTPTLALVCVMNALADMTEKAWRASLDALRGYKNGKPVSVDAIKKIEDEVYGMQGEIMDYLVQLTRRELSDEQAQAIPVLMHCVNDAERISDLAYLIARRAASQNTATSKFTDSALRELKDIIEKSCTIADLTLESLRGGPAGSSKAISIIMQDMKIMTHESIQGHVDRLQKGACKPERGMLYVEVLAALENIIRHLDNIAQRSEQLVSTE